MNPIATSVIVLACVFGGALAGLFLRNRLPDEHLQDDSKDIVKLGIGVVATMAALVLGLLVSSAKGSFDRTSDEVTLGAAKIVQLNHALAQYGDETKEIRGAFRRGVAAKAKGKVIGRPKGGLGKSKLDGREQEIQLLLAKEVSKSSIAKIMGVSRTALSHFINTRQLS